MTTQQLPQLGDTVFYTDGGLETTLIFHHGLDLPHFAAFDLLKAEPGTRTLRDYYARYAKIAVAAERGFILETPTWRASRDWGQLLGYDADELVTINRRAVEMMEKLRWELSTKRSPMVISGNVGPRGDGYDPSVQMSASAATDYHREQISTFAAAGVDLVSAVTLNYVAEATGFASAAAEFGIPAVVSFTTETDGRLPTGQSLQEAIEAVDESAAVAPAYYMINCAHPDHFSGSLSNDSWVKRIRGVRANASRQSHAELDECEVLDAGNPQEFGDLHRELQQQFSHLNIFGGCCGTDHRHVEAVDASLRRVAA